MFVWSPEENHQIPGSTFNICITPNFQDIYVQPVIFLSESKCLFFSTPGTDTDEFDNMAEEDYDEEVVEFLLKVEEIILDEE